jgi:starch synthase
LAPLYLKTAYHNEPFFTNSKIVLMLDDQEYKRPFSTKFSDKLRIDGVNNIDVRNIADFPVGYEELMRLAIDYSDAIVYATPNVNQRLMNYAETKGKPILAYEPQEDPMEACRRQLEFMENIANDEKAE